MNETPESLSSEVSRLAAELKHLEQRLDSEPSPDIAALNDLRHAVDSLRLKAWSVSELINARYTREDPCGVLAFLAAERLRRLDQLVRNLCGDIERGTITFQAGGMNSLFDSVSTLQQRLAQISGQNTPKAVKEINGSTQPFRIGWRPSR
jgi:hypothetical protein